MTCDTCRCQQADNTLCEAENGVDPEVCEDIVVDECVPDTFENLFGVNVFDNDTLPGPCEAETGVVDPSLWTIYRDMGTQYGVACNDLDANTGDRFYSGGANEGDLPLIWIEGDCTIPANTQVGSYDHPFILVVHGDVTMNSNSSMYGILFAFSDVYTASEDFDITVNGSPVVYGVMVINGEVDLPTGSFTLVYSNNILEKLSNIDGDYNELARFPGSWTDIK
ncbi:hypothetical protein [Marinobacterium aestuariivivens]|uniref:Uncharacterized protein n=1 Tax=Marinobacterium aestuariivivens TaxID=1698799 RepID=A0ABW2A0L1_9GAMM